MLLFNLPNLPNLHNLPPRLGGLCRSCRLCRLSSMSDRVALVGAGEVPLRPLSPRQSYREMGFEAATRAYDDAGVTHQDIDSFVSVCEDFHEGTSITDEYTPDQLGAVLRPVHTVAGDGLQGVAAAVMLIRTGIADLVAVEAHCKTSNILAHEQVLTMALDPSYERLPGITPHFVAGMEMRRYLHETGAPEDAVAMVVVKNRRHALSNPVAAYGEVLSPDDVLASAAVCAPLREREISPPAARPNRSGSVVWAGHRIVPGWPHDLGARRPTPVWRRRWPIRWRGSPNPTRKSGSPRWMIH